MNIRVQAEDIDIAEALRALSEPGADGHPGAVATFVGHVRDRDNGRTITAMAVEHYPGMTEAEMARIRDEAMARWPITKATIIHRIGRLLPGDRIVFVGCASAHRDAASEATRFIIDFLKTDAPFWKAEEIDGVISWVEASEDDAAVKEGWLRD